MVTGGPDFDPFAWHDCAIWRLEVRADTGDSRSGTDALVLHLDYILEWMGGDRDVRFRVAPARLAFHGVTDLCVLVDWGATGYRQAVHEMTIDRIERTVVTGQQVFLDRPYYAWAIFLSWPKLGRVTFGAFGYTQTFTREPITVPEQTLTWEQRGESA